MEGMDLLEGDILDVHVGNLDPHCQYMPEQNDKVEHIAKIDNINKKISRC